MEKSVKRKVAVHDGAFHADEVTACAFLIFFDLVDEEKVVRTRDPKTLAQCEFVCDVGGEYDPAEKRFDHHQSSYEGELSSAGMVLRYLCDEALISQEEYAFFNNSLVKGVDDHDNGRSPQIAGVSTFSLVIANFNPVLQGASLEEFADAFHQALTFALGHLRRLHARYLYTLECRLFVKEAMQKGGKCLFFDRGLPWIESFFALEGETHEALFILMPAGEHWKLKAIPPNLARRMEVRVPLPEKWAGLLGVDLQKVSGIQGAVFCHKGRFTSVWETRDDALQALAVVLKEAGIEDENAI